MKRTLYIYVSALAIVCACSKTDVSTEEPVQKEQEEIAVPEGYVLYHLSSYCSKVAIGGEDGKTLSWEAGDKITLVTDKKTYVSESIEISDDGKSAEFTFTIAEGDTPLYGVYPSSVSCKIVNDVLNVGFPADLTIGTYANSNVMSGKIIDGSIAFKHIAHLIKFTTENTDMTRIQICELGENKIIKADVAVTFDENGDVTVSPTQNNTRTSFSCEVKGAGTYYLAVLPSEEAWGGIGLRWATGPDGKRSYSTGYINSKALTPKRNTITNFGNIDNLFKEAVEVKDGNHLADILNTEDNIAKIWYLNGKTLKLGGSTFTLASAPEIKNTRVGEGIAFTIQGAGESTIIDGNGKRFISVAQGDDHNKNATSITIDGVIIQNCKPAGSGGAISIAGNSDSNKRASLTIKNSTLTQNGNTSNSGGALYVGSYSNVTLENCKFTGNSATNGASIYTANGSGISVTATKCDFIKEIATTFGGAVYIAGGTQEYIDCTFDGCSSTNSPGGAIYCNNSSAVMNLTRCTFTKCKGFSTTTNNGEKAGGAIFIGQSGGDVSIESCVFDANEGKSGSVICTENNCQNIFLRVNNSVFKNNKGASRGMIRIHQNNVAFFNNCSFYDNEMYTGDWGRVLHSDKADVCFNNCTIHNNTTNPSGSGQSNSCGLHASGNTIIINTTIVNSNQLCLIRSKDQSVQKILIANSILLNTYTNGKVFDQYNMYAATCNTHNCYLGKKSDTKFIKSATDDATTGKWVSDADKMDVSSLTNGHFDDVNLVYLWDGPVEEGEYKKTTEEAVKNLLNNWTVTTSNNKVKAAFKTENGNVGKSFATWVASVGVDNSRKNSFTYDALGNERTPGGTWPGAIEKH